MQIITLTLDKKIHTTIRISDSIKLSIFRDYHKYISNQIRIGIDAPKNVNIRRSELPYAPKERT